MSRAGFRSSCVAGFHWIVKDLHAGRWVGTRPADRIRGRDGGAFPLAGTRSRAVPGHWFHLGRSVNPRAGDRLQHERGYVQHVQPGAGIDSIHRVRRPGDPVGIAPELHAHERPVPDDPLGTLLLLPVDRRRCPELVLVPARIRRPPADCLLPCRRLRRVRVVHQPAPRVQRHPRPETATIPCGRIETPSGARRQRQARP